MATCLRWIRRRSNSKNLPKGCAETFGFLFVVSYEKYGRHYSLTHNKTGHTIQAGEVELCGAQGVEGCSMGRQAGVLGEVLPWGGVNTQKGFVRSNVDPSGSRHLQGRHFAIKALFRDLSAESDFNSVFRKAPDAEQRRNSSNWQYRLSVIAWPIFMGNGK